MQKRLFDYDDITGVTTWFHYDEDADDGSNPFAGVSMEYQQDCEPILDFNKAKANETDARTQIKDGWWHYGSIPMALVLKWQIEEGLDVYDPNHMPRVLAKLNSRDYSYLKTTSGTHARKDS